MKKNYLRIFLNKLINWNNPTNGHLVPRMIIEPSRRVSIPISFHPMQLHAFSIQTCTSQSIVIKLSIPYNGSVLYGYRCILAYSAYLLDANVLYSSGSLVVCTYSNRGPLLSSEIIIKIFYSVIEPTKVS